MGVIIAMIAICAACSTAASRKAGADAARPYGRIAWIAVAVIWGSIILLPHWSNP